MLFAFGGGLFIPLSTYPHVLQMLAKFTPLYGLNQLVHAPQLGGSVHMKWVLNAVAWLVIFAGRGDLAVPQGHGASLRE